MLLFDRVRHDDEEKVEILCLARFLHLLSLLILTTYVLEVVVINCLFESLDARFVTQFDDVTVINIDVKSSLLRQLVEFVVQELPVMNVLLEAEDGPLSEVDWLVHNSSKDLGVIKWSGRDLSWLVVVTLCLCVNLRPF